jgi:hypothetical protein
LAGITGITGIKYIAEGREGLIFADDKHAYKLFFEGKTIFQEGQLDFIKGHVLQRSIPHLVPLREIFDDGKNLVFKMDYINGSRYAGGYLSQLRDMLISLRKSGVAHRNIHPKNLIVSNGELILSDLGRSLFPLTDKEYAEMIKRTHLTHECFAVPNLSELMTQSLTREEIKELYGWKYFERTLEQPKSKQYPVSLLIKASPIEWQTIDFQIKHIVGQLSSPAYFKEVIVITDKHKGPFLRQYAQPNYEVFFQKLSELKENGWIDEIVIAPLDCQSIKETYFQWFGLESTETHAERGHHVYTQLYGFNKCKGDYILQIDSDCLIAHRDHSHDYLEEMIQVFEKDTRAITVPFRIADRSPVPYHRSNCPVEWRTEVRCCMLKKDRLLGTLPLPNKLNSKEQLVLPWHRSLDESINMNDWHSYRGSDNRTFFIHLPNDNKIDVNSWFEIISIVEQGIVPEFQNGYVDLQGEHNDWIGKRYQDNSEPQYNNISS